MSILTPIAAASARDTADTPARLQRHDGWTPAAQRGFLEAIAEGVPVGAACRRVGLTHQSAYAFRKRAAGASFALGWQAASLIARHCLADELASRAIDGQVETITRADGSVITRHRFDNRLAMSMLTRLDRLADNQVAEGTHQAARLVAQEFDAFLDLIDADEGPARAGLFVGLRVGGATDMTAAEMAPVVALARADRWCRTGAALADEVRIDDLDPAQRAHWSADQWARAEAAGLLVLAPPPVAAKSVRSGDATDRDGNPQLMQLHGRDQGRDQGDDQAGGGADQAPGEDDDRVWWDEFEGHWRTDFPSPPDFDGEEDGRFGEDGYSRTLSSAEQAVIDAIEEEQLAPLRAAGEAARDAWFGWAPQHPVAAPPSAAPPSAAPPSAAPPSTGPLAETPPADLPPADQPEDSMQVPPDPATAPLVAPLAAGTGSVCRREKAPVAKRGGNATGAG